MVIRYRCVIYKKGKLRFGLLAIKVKKVNTASSVSYYKKSKKKDYINFDSYHYID